MFWENLLKCSPEGGDEESCLPCQAKVENESETVMKLTRNLFCLCSISYTPRLRLNLFLISVLEGGRDETEWNAEKEIESVWFGFYLIFFFSRTTQNYSVLICLILLTVFFLFVAKRVEQMNKAKKKRSTRLKSIVWLGAPPNKR